MNKRGLLQVPDDEWLNKKRKERLGEMEKLKPTKMVRRLLQTKNRDTKIPVKEIHKSTGKTIKKN